MWTTKTCSACGDTKPWDDDPFIRYTKASGFLKARCWDCHYKAHTAWNRKLKPCPNTAVLVPYGTAYARKKVIDPQTGKENSYGAVKQKRRRTNPLKRLADGVRTSIGQAFNDKGYSKDTKTEAVLGCSFGELKDHLEDQFKPGMTWENMGSEWHIDHNLPLNAAKSIEEVICLCHFTNLVPLWKQENMSKGSKCDPEEVREYLKLVQGK
jgi:hypothetical protein